MTSPINNTLWLIVNAVMILKKQNCSWIYYLLLITGAMNITISLMLQVLWYTHIFTCQGNRSRQKLNGVKKEKNFKYTVFSAWFYLHAFIYLKYSFLGLSIILTENLSFKLLEKNFKNRLLWQSCLNSSSNNYNENYFVEY